MNGPAPWQRIVADTVRKWADSTSAGGEGSARPRPTGGADHSQLVLQEVEFEDVDSYSFTQPHDWTIESIIGFLYSSSRCSQRVLGDNVQAFEADLEDTLLAHDAGGQYRQIMQCGYTLGRKPAHPKNPIPEQSGHAATLS